MLESRSHRILILTTICAAAGCSGDRSAVGSNEIPTLEPVALDEAGPSGFSANDVLALLGATRTFTADAVDNSEDGADMDVADPLIDGAYAPFVVSIDASTAEAQVVTWSNGDTSQPTLGPDLWVRVTVRVESSTSNDLDVTGPLVVQTVGELSAATMLIGSSWPTETNRTWELSWMEDQPLSGTLPQWVTDGVASRFSDTQCAADWGDSVASNGSLGITMTGNPDQAGLSVGSWIWECGGLVAVDKVKLDVVHN